MTTSAPLDELVLPFRFYNAAAQFFRATDTEVVLDGPAGTGKTRACLEKLHYLCATTPQMRALIVRKTLISLKGSALVTFDEKVQPRLDGVVFYGDTGKRPAQYRYPNGASVTIGGLDRPEKVMSSEYDFIYVNEASELTLNDWEALSSRLRNGMLSYQQLAGDVNPQAPKHWLYSRMQAGLTRRLISRHEDNPTVTAEYLARLDRLTGVRRARLYLGLWVAAEGTVYEDVWDPARNLVDRFSIPPDWPRYLAIDFGYTHPFVCQWWATDPDGRAYRYREIYKTQRIVEDHAADIKRLSRWGEKGGEPLPRAIICDHDAEDRATLERHLGMHTTPAKKSVSDGIQAVASRLRPAGDGKPRLFFLRDSLVARDPFLAEAAEPACTEEEFDSYVWRVSSGAVSKDEPVKERDHGCFVAGTFVETINGPQAIETIVPGTLVLTRQGYRRVLAAGMTQRDAEVATLHLSDGRSLTATPDHPIYRNGQTYTALRELRYGDTIESADSYLERLTLCAIRASQRSLSTRASSSDATRSRFGGRVATTTRPMRRTASTALNRSTARYGRTQTAPSPLGVRFTTRTAIPSIMNSATLNALPRTSTKLSIGYGKNQKRVNGCAPTCFTRRRVARDPPGMGVRKAAPGIVSWGAWHGSTPNTRITSACNAASHSSLASCIAATRGSALMLARPLPAWPLGQTMSSERARSVGSSSRSIATAPSSAAHVHVLSISAQAGCVPVYNLTVQGAHEYFANGVLVHNCDATRYTVAHLDLVPNQVSYYRDIWR